MINKIVDNMRYGKMDNNIVSSDYIEFKDSHEAEAWGDKYYKEWSQKYKEAMQIAEKVIKTSGIHSCIEYYCGYSYREINEYLRSDIDRSGSNLYREMADTLALTLSMAPRVPDNVIVYRLVCDQFIQELIENNKNGLPKQEKGFVSTSLTSDIVTSEEFYSGHKNMLKIHVKANTVGVYVNGVARRNEEELLLYPNGYFRLLKKPYEYKNKKTYECELLYF